MRIAKHVVSIQVNNRSKGWTHMLWDRWHLRHSSSWPEEPRRWMIQDTDDGSIRIGDTQRRGKSSHLDCPSKVNPFVIFASFNSIDDIASHNSKAIGPSFQSPEEVAIAIDGVCDDYCPVNEDDFYFTVRISRVSVLRRKIAQSPAKEKTCSNIPANVLDVTGTVIEATYGRRPPSGATP